jgi:periplasmic copper chaperone A
MGFLGGFLAALVMLILLAALPASAAEIKAGDLTINDFHVRATPGGAKVGAGYLTGQQLLTQDSRRCLCGR